MWTTRKGVLRDNAGGFPLYGIGSINGCLSGDCFALLVPVAPLLTQGVTLTDFASFLNTPSGSTFLSNECQITMLRKNSYLWCPWGYLCIILVHSLTHDGVSMQHGFSIPNFNQNLASQCNEATLQALFSFNYSWAKKQGKAMWTERAEWLIKFFTQLGVQTE